MGKASVTERFPAAFLNVLVTAVSSPVEIFQKGILSHDTRTALITLIIKADTERHSDRNFLSFLNVQPDLLTKTLATCVSEIVPTLTQKSQTALMKCQFAAVNTRNSFPLVHQAQLAVRSAFLGFAEKPVGVGGDT